MTKEETDLIIAEQNKSTEEILKAVAKVKSDYHELCNLKDMRIKELEQQIEEMKCCQNCDHYRWSNGDDWCNDHYGQPTYDEECKGKWKLRR